MPILSYAVIAVAAYLLGSIPTGYLAGRARGIDIRTVGSGNMGATNVFRTLGKTAGVIVLVVDGLKGYAACTWLCDGTAWRFLTLPRWTRELYRIIAGISAVLGHNFTCWLKFKGGKGIATSAGVFVALAPLALGIALGTWIVVFALSRYVSVASIAAAVALPAAVWMTAEQPDRCASRRRRSACWPSPNTSATSSGCSMARNGVSAKKAQPRRRRNENHRARSRRVGNRAGKGPSRKRQRRGAVGH